MAELKPCPFCGSNKVGVRCKSRLAGWTGIDARVEIETYSVRCNVCHARGATESGKVIASQRHMYRDHMPEWAVTSGELKQKAEDAWNTRNGGADNGKVFL